MLRRLSAVKQLTAAAALLGLFTPYNANQVTRTFSSTCSRHLSCAQRPDAVTTGTLSRGVYQSAVVYCSIKKTTTPNNCIHLDTFLRIFLVPVFSCGQVQSGRKQGGREAEVQQGGRRRAAGDVMPWQPLASPISITQIKQ